MFKFKRKTKSPFVATLKKNLDFHRITRDRFTDVDISKIQILGLSTIQSKPFLIHKETILRQSGGLVTGDYEEREYKLANINFSNGKHCDCCGEKIPYLPYGNETLCSRCKINVEGQKLKSDLISNFENNKKQKLEKVWFVNQN